MINYKLIALIFFCAISCSAYSRAPHEFTIKGSQTFSDRGNEGYLNVDTTLHLRMWTLMGEPAYVCKLKWDLNHYQLRKNESKGYERTSKAPRDIEKDLSIYNVYAFVAINDQVTFYCDTGVLQASGGGYSFNVPGSKDWDEQFVGGDYKWAASSFNLEGRDLKRFSLNEEQAKSVFKQLGNLKPNQVQYIGHADLYALKRYAIEQSREKEQKDLLQAKEKEKQKVRSTISKELKEAKKEDSSPFANLLEDLPDVMSETIEKKQHTQTDGKLFTVNKKYDELKVKISPPSKTSKKQTHLDENELKERLLSSLKKRDPACKVSKCFDKHPLNSDGSHYDPFGLNVAKYNACIEQVECEIPTPFTNNGSLWGYKFEGTIIVHPKYSAAEEFGVLLDSYAKVVSQSSQNQYQSYLIDLSGKTVLGPHYALYLKGGTVIGRDDGVELDGGKKKGKRGYGYEDFCTGRYVTYKRFYDSNLKFIRESEEFSERTTITASLGKPCNCSSQFSDPTATVRCQER